MFDVGGVYAPYDVPKSPSVESGEIVDGGSGASHPPSPPPAFVQCFTATPLPHQRHYIAVVCVRAREVNRQAWFEFLMELSGDMYQFPQTRGGATTAAHVLGGLMRRGGIPRLHDMERHFEIEVQQGRTSSRVYMFPYTAARGAREVQSAPPSLVWVCESELVTHEHVGAPSAFGIPIAPWSLRTLNSLHPNMRFASATPPLVLYHGTDAGAVPGILKHGLVPCPKSAGMLGAGVYFARWDKAKDFALQDASNERRAVPGVVIRAIVTTGTTLEMRADMRCTCGCGKPFVDHNGERSRKFRTAFVPDNSRGATKRAEWCVKEPTAIFIDGIFSLASVPSFHDY